VYYFIHLGIQHAESTVFAIVIAAMCVSILLLCYGFWASACGGKGAKYSLAIIYLVYALVLLAIGIALLALKNQITDAVETFFTKKPEEDAVRTAFENELGCKWNTTTEPQCKDKFEQLYKSVGIGVGAGLIVLFAVLLLGDIVAWRWLCSKWEEAPTSAKPTMTSPLTYSW
jgi:hypothetical protein